MEEWDWYDTELETLEQDRKDETFDEAIEDLANHGIEMFHVWDVEKNCGFRIECVNHVQKMRIDRVFF